MRRRQRHPALEIAVFAAALLLSAFIARELWVRRASTSSSSADGKGPSAPHSAVVANPYRPPLPLAASARRTEQGVSIVAPVKLSRVQRRKPKPNVVPVPK